MHRPNVKHVNITEMILAKRREQEQAEKQAAKGVDRAIETLVWLCALGITLTIVGLYAAAQEGWW